MNELLETWWVELSVDGINAVSKNIDWIPGDQFQQSILIGAHLVNEFRPFGPIYNLNSVRLEPEMNLINRSLDGHSNSRSIVMRYGFVGM